VLSLDSDSEAASIRVGYAESSGQCPQAQSIVRRGNDGVPRRRGLIKARRCAFSYGGSVRHVGHEREFTNSRGLPLLSSIRRNHPANFCSKSKPGGTNAIYGTNITMRKNYDFSRAIKNPYARRLQRQLAVAPITIDEEENRIAIGLSCANCSGIDTAKIYEFIAKQGSDYEAYALQPRRGLAAAIDFYLVLNSAASVASIAGFIWMAYDQWIAPKKRDPKNDTGIHIVIRGPDETLVKVWLGKDVSTKDEFEHTFKVIVEKAQDPKWRAAHERTIAEIQQPGSWTRAGLPKKPKNEKTERRSTRDREYQP